MRAPRRLPNLATLSSPAATAPSETPPDAVFSSDGLCHSPCHSFCAESASDGASDFPRSCSRSARLRSSRMAANCPGVPTEYSPYVLWPLRLRPETDTFRGQDDCAVHRPASCASGCGPLSGHADCEAISSRVLASRRAVCSGVAKLTIAAHSREAQPSEVADPLQQFLPVSVPIEHHCCTSSRRAASSELFSVWFNTR